VTWRRGVLVLCRLLLYKQVQAPTRFGSSNSWVGIATCSLTGACRMLHVDKCSPLCDHGNGMGSCLLNVKLHGGNMNE